MIDQIGKRNLADLWAEQVGMHPDSSWLVFEDRDGKVSEYTYAEFDRWVNRIAAGFGAAGVGPGDAVVLHLRNCPEFIGSWFALAALGAVMVPSNVANTATELGFILQRSRAVAVIAGADYLEPAGRAAAGGGCRIIAVGDASAHPDVDRFDDLLVDAPRGENRPPVRDETVLQILFTSGTTAAPKGVMATHANALWAGESGARGQGLDRHDRCLTALPLFHVNGQAVTVLAALTVGATVVLLEEFAPGRYFEQIRRHRATQTSVVAQQALALLAQPASNADTEHRLRRVGFAINIPVEAKQRFESRFGVSLINIYGLSEAMAIVSMSPLDRPQRYPSVGLPALTRTVRVLDAYGEELPPGEIGEIVVSGVPGRTVMLGYFEDPEATAAVMSGGWVRTGDAGWVDEAGYLYFYERQKDVIKSSGQNVSASEVEAVLNAHPGVAESAVIGVADERRGESAQACVVRLEGSAVDADELQRHCAEHLSGYKVPRQIEFLDALPRTSVGKLAKRELRARTP